MTALRIERTFARNSQRGPIFRHTWPGGSCDATNTYAVCREILKLDPDAPSHAEVWADGKHLLTVDIRKGASLTVVERGGAPSVEKWSPYSVVRPQESEEEGFGPGVPSTTNASL